MYQYKIALETMTDANEFVSITSRIHDAQILVEDGAGLCVNAKSIMGMLYALEFDDLICASDIDIYAKIEKFVL